MSELEFGPGELIFAEGSPSSFVLRITAGEADVTKSIEGKEVLLGRLKAGDYAGEMGVLEGRPRGATVRAVSPVTADRFGREEFLAQVSQDNVMALKLLVRLSERLNALDQSFAIARAGGEPEQQPQPAPAAGGGGAVTLQAGSEILAAVLPLPEISVGSFPYVVGRTPGPGEAAPPGKIHLMLDDSRPYRLSRAHFRIERSDDGYRVRDLGSVLGTQVNGEPIGSNFSLDTAPLTPGENSVVAGGDESPYSFKLTVLG